jgi:hypothetical protein
MGETTQIEKQKAESHDTETYQVHFVYMFAACRKFKFEIGIQQSNFSLFDSFVIVSVCHKGSVCYYLFFS